MAMTLTIWSGFGLLGVALFLGAYGALQLGLIRGRSVTYTVLNLAGAIAMLVSLSEAFNLASALSNILWIVLSVIGLVRMAMNRARQRFTEEEQTFLSRHFANIPPHLARRFLDLGHWQVVSEGTILTRQGAAVHELIYIASGAAAVRAHGAQVAEILPGALIGEMTVMHGGTASADVEITQAARLFTLPRKALVRELQGDHELALVVAASLQGEAQRKLDRANRTRAGVL